MTKVAQITKAFLSQQIIKINVNFIIFLFQLKRNKNVLEFTFC